MPKRLVAAGDRLLASHATWVERTHIRTGKLALLHYSIIKGPVRRRGLNPTSRKTGKITFVIHQVYASPAGLGDHWRSAILGWQDYNEFIGWAAKARVTALHNAPIVHSVSATGTHSNKNSNKNKTALTQAFTVRKSKRVAEGRRLFKSHAGWVARSLVKQDEPVVLRYNVAIAKERGNPLNRRSRRTRRTIFVMTAVFDSPAGLADYWKRMETEWKDYKAFVRWARRSTIGSLHGSPIVHSLWQ